MITVTKIDQSIIYWSEKRSKIHCQNGINKTEKKKNRSRYTGKNQINIRIRIFGEFEIDKELVLYRT